MSYKDCTYLMLVWINFCVVHLQASRSPKKDLVSEDDTSVKKPRFPNRQRLWLILC